MKNADVLNILNDINSFIEKNEYSKAIVYINTKKNEIKNEIDPASEYMDKLINEIK